MNTQQGSSLIGVAILTLVMGFLMTGAIYLFNTYEKVKEGEETHQKTVSLQEALENFIAIHRRYPCPADIELAPDESGFGLEDCSISDVLGRDSQGVKIGTVPVRTLNVPESMIVDGFGKRMIYAITSDMTDAATADIKNGLGAISIYHKTTDIQESLSSEEGYVIYALLSPGEDDRGAYDIQGREILPCDSSSIAGENCDMDAVFFTTQKSTVGDSTDFTHNFAFKAASVQYNWYNGAWSGCGKDINNYEWSTRTNKNRYPENFWYPTPSCFSSNQAREVECRDRQGNAVDDTQCAHTAKPLRVRACPLGPCRWNIIPAVCSNPEPAPPTPEPPAPEPPPPSEPPTLGELDNDWCWVLCQNIGTDFKWKCRPGPCSNVPNSPRCSKRTPPAGACSGNSGSPSVW